jgi:hypothetical protein
MKRISPMAAGGQTDGATGSDGGVQGCDGGVAGSNDSDDDV